RLPGATDGRRESIRWEHPACSTQWSPDGGDGEAAPARMAALSRSVRSSLCTPRVGSSLKPSVGVVGWLGPWSSKRPLPGGPFILRYSRDMAFRTERVLDDAGWRILTALQQDARLSFSELSRRVGLSPPAVAERVRRLEDVGVITGYRVELGLEKL